MEHVIIFGGTGFIGKGLAAHLSEHGFNPILIARNAPQEPIGFEFHPWDAHSVGEWKELLNGARAVVNLVGKSVDCRKTPDNCDLILRSRVDATKAIGKALQKIPDPPPVWVQMSTAHIYGDPPYQICTEDSTFGYGLAPHVGKAWEESFLQEIPKSVRGVRLRTSFVIGKNGGALKRLKKITRFGLGGKLGSGKQGFSWIHEEDMNRLIHQAIVQEGMEGVYVASAPEPVSNRSFMKTLRKKMKVPLGIPTPEPLVRLGALTVLDTDPEIALYGRYVRSKRLEDEGFQFKYPELETALEDLIRRA